MTNRAEGIYYTEERRTKNGLQYFFVSKGDTNIVKIVEYSYVQDVDGISIYNLGFGNYDSEKDRVTDDEIATNNGDQYKVLNTVLSTIPDFFSIYHNAVMMVQGSDSRPDFIEKCKMTCRKRCGNKSCKNFHRRINIYRNYVNNNYNRLKDEYTFWGGNKNDDSLTILESYEPGKWYESVFFRKNV